MSRDLGSKSRRLEEGDVCSFPILGGGFGAFQVLRAKKKTVEVGILDSYTPKPPVMVDLRDARVLRRPGDGAPVRHEPEEDTAVPWWATRIGNRKVIERFSTPCAQHPAWEWIPDLVSTAWFDANVAGGDAERDEQLGSAADDAFLERVRIDHRIRVVRCSTRGGTLDLRDTRIRVLTLEIGAERRTVLRAPRWLRKLEIHGAVENIDVELAQSSFPFRLVLHGEELPRKPRPWLADVERLILEGLREADVRRLVPFRRLRHVKLGGSPHGPAVITHAEALRSLRSLQALELSEIDNLDLEAFPERSELPALVECTLFRPVKTDAAGIRRKLGELSTLCIIDAINKPKIDSSADAARPPKPTKRKSKTTAPHPFSAWVEENEELGRGATLAWQRALERANEPGRKMTPAGAEAIIVTFLKALNRLDKQHSFDTIRREDAGDIIVALASKTGKVTPARAQELFDEWRDF